MGVFRRLTSEKDKYIKCIFERYASKLQLWAIELLCSGFHGQSFPVSEFAKLGKFTNLEECLQFLEQKSKEPWKSDEIYAENGGLSSIEIPVDPSKASIRIKEALSVIRLVPELKIGFL